MLTTIGRYSTLGVWVTFRLEGTEELLWRAPMNILPREQDHVGELNGNSAVGTWYKVEGIKFEFQQENGGTYGDPPLEYNPDHSEFGVCILVSVIP